MALWKKALIRGAIPFVIMSGISGIMWSQNFSLFEVRSTFLTGIIITSVAAASTIYEIDNWTLFKQSWVHLLVMLVTVLPCLLISGWFSLNTVWDYLYVIGIYCIVGFVLWTFFYLLFTKWLNKK
nr:DUF3021 family protein [Streptococcus gallolyticus]